MNANLQTVIAELINERRELQARVSQIDEALLALERIGGRIEKRGRTRNVSPEGRRRLSEAMRQRWEVAKASGRLLTDRKAPEPEFSAVS